MVFDADSHETDHLIVEATSRILSKNPFLQSSIRITSNWAKFCADIRGAARKTADIRSFLEYLWCSPLPERLVIRRLLLHVHTDESVAYVQDRDIVGVSEHNIYGGVHSQNQTSEICLQILNSLLSAGVTGTDALVERICTNGRRLIGQARWFESKNGTELKPSFAYVQLFLTDCGFRVVSPSEAGIRAIGYHSEISSERVKPYTNLKVVTDSTGRVLCILKAKFFRINEFPRRCKEEAFVGLSLKYQLKGTTFSRRFDFPLIMYIDMAKDCLPPAYAIKRLMSFGWQVVFSTEQLIATLSSRTA